MRKSQLYRASAWTCVAVVFLTLVSWVERIAKFVIAAAFHFRQSYFPEPSTPMIVAWVALLVAAYDFVLRGRTAKKRERHKEMREAFLEFAGEYPPSRRQRDARERCWRTLKKTLFQLEKKQWEIFHQRGRLLNQRDLTSEQFDAASAQADRLVPKLLQAEREIARLYRVARYFHYRLPVSRRLSHLAGE